MLLTNAIQGFLLHKSVEGLSKRTLETYERRLNLLVQFLDNPDVESITTHDLMRFVDYLRNDYTPLRWSGSQPPLAGRTLHNYWIALRSFYTWAESEMDLPDAMKKVPAPKSNTAQTDQFTQDEVKAILKAADNLRDRCILLTLLDTGMRASELCALKVQDVDLKTGKVSVQGKGAKERHVYLGDVARRSLWKYLADREDGPLFATHNGRPMQRHWLRELIANIGKKAGVAHAHPHRFRHTFAVEYLRHDGDVFTLQILLGHSSLVMVRRYAKLAAVDAERVHRKASPVDNWLK
jgi:integrase/recombinase XerD